MAQSIGVCSRASFDFAEVKSLFSPIFSIPRANYSPAVSSSFGKSRSITNGFALREDATRELSIFKDEDDDDLSHVMKFKMSDFRIQDRVSIGLGNRGEEVVCEATVEEASSPLFNTRVLLRRLVSIQAKRRGRREIEVLKSLAHRRLMYHLYSMQVHGYVCSSTTGDSDSFTLVHGYHGSFSLRHWLQQSDWIPTLEATLALDEETTRRVRYDTLGGSCALFEF